MTLHFPTVPMVISVASLVFLVGAFSASAESFDSASLSIPDTVTLSSTGGQKVISRDVVSNWFISDEQWAFRNGVRTEAWPVTACPWALSFCDFALREETREYIRTKASFSLNEPAIRNDLETFRIQSRREPMDALFTVGENQQVTAFSPSRDGSEINVEASLDMIIEKLEGMASSEGTALDISLPETVIPPTISSTDANELGITEFLGEGRTNFSGSPKNRIFNIKRAIKQFQGVLIAPGEEFSFVQHLGEVDGEHGYLPELVIKRGRTEPEFGGGICQVSTTLFRAALNTGQKITERRNHAYPVSYYKPYGMDATIYIPKPDFKFANNTPASILLQATIEGSELVFRFYGTLDGRSVSLDGPHITARTPEGGLKTVFTQTVVDRDGHTLIEDTFKSAYEPASKYPHPGEEKLDRKPDNWSQKQWDDYRRTGALPR